MSLFSKSHKNQPEANSLDAPPEQLTPPQAEPGPTPWVMTEAQYEHLLKKLDRIIDNQVINGNNIAILERKLNTLQEDMGTSIRNELILGRDQDELMKDVKQIKFTVNTLQSDLNK